MATAFTRCRAAPEQVSAADMDKQHAKIGQLVVEGDFLADASHQLPGTRPSGDHAYGKALPVNGTKNGKPGTQAERSPTMRSADTGAVQSEL